MVDDAATHGRDLQRACEEALRSVVLDQGRRIGREPARVRALLADELAGQSHAARAYIDALVIAAEQEVPRKLVAPGGDAAAGGRLAETLESERGLSPRMAGFAVAAWAQAVGVVAAAPEPELSTQPASQSASGIAPVTERPEPDPPEAAPTAAPTPPTPPALQAADPPAPAPGVHRREPSGSRRPGRPVAVVVAAVLLIGIVWAGFHFLRSGDNPAAQSSAPQQQPPSATHDMSHEPQASGTASAEVPHAMPEPTSVAATIMAEATKQAGGDGAVQQPPTGKPVGTAPVPAKSQQATLISVKQVKSLSPLLTSSDQPDCAAVSGTKNLQWCEIKLPVTVKGNVSDWSIGKINLVEQHGIATAQGHSIVYRPFHNGTFVEHIVYELKGKNAPSTRGVIQLNIACNTNYACH